MNTIVADHRQSIRQRVSLSLRKYTAVLRVSVANNLAYIIEVVFRTLFLVVFIYVFEQLWKTTFAVRGITALDGFDINTMIWYLAATETLALSLPQLTRLVDEEVRSGQLAYLLGRPCSYVLYHFAQYLGERLVRLVLNSAVAFTIALIFVGPPPFTWMGLLAWPLVVFLAASIEYVVYFSIGLLAFWTEETTPFFLIVNRLALVLGGVLAPGGFATADTGYRPAAAIQRHTLWPGSHPGTFSTAAILLAAASTGDYHNHRQPVALCALPHGNAAGEY